METARQIREHRVCARDFDPAEYRAGCKHSLALDLGPEATGITLPVLLARGARPGKTVVVTAGVHGDEYEGVRAIWEVFAGLDPAAMAGTLIAVPVANPPAFWNGTRTSPLDQGNLARVFPGRTDGSATEVIAFRLGDLIIARADFFLDLHSGGVKLLMPCMVGYDAGDPRSREAALAFGAPVIWAHSNIAPGRTVSFAASRRIPWLYTEAAGAGRIDARELEMLKAGLLNLLRHLQVLPGVVNAQPPIRVLHGDGNIDASVAAIRPGFLIPAVELLDNVKTGQKLGHTVDLHGQLIETFYSSCDGAVAMVHAFPVVQPGEPLFLVTGSIK